MASDVDHLIARIPSTKGDKAERVRELVRLAHAEYQPWATKARKAERYYMGHQWDDIAIAQQRRRLRLTDNVIADDIDKKVARLEEAEPIMEAHGRGAEDFSLGAAWRDLIDYADNWSGETHDSARDIRRRCWRGAHVIGDYFEWIYWDPNEENGLGFVVSEDVPGYNVVWDAEAKSTQLRDARWVCRFDAVEIQLLEQEFPVLKGKINGDVPSLFMGNAHEQARGRHYQTLSQPVTGSQAPVATSGPAKAYRIEFWEKRRKKTVRYLLEGMAAITRDADGKVVPLNEELFDKLPSAQKQKYEEVTVDDYELWKQVVVNEHVVHDKLSSYDTTQGGHGHYPLARYCATTHPDETHSRGDVEPLMGYQDVINQTMSYGLEKLFLDSSSILAIQRGAQPKSEEAKLDRVGEVALQRYYYYPGQPLPQAVPLGNPQGAQLYQTMHDWLTQRKDQRSNVTNVHRAAPQYDMSGRAIRALMAEADLSTLKIKRSIESGLRQATLLRIALIQQYMRTTRMIRITPKAGTGDEPYSLYVTPNEEKTASTQGLSKPQDDPMADFYKTRNGEQARILEIADEGVRKFDLRLTLDTGKERNRDERMELATQVFNYAGAGAGVETALWIFEMMEMPNLENLAKALRAEDAKSQMVQQVTAIQEQTGMSLQEMAQLAALVAQGGAPGAGGGPGGPPQGPGGPQPPAAPGGPGGPPAAPEGAPQ